MTLKIGVYVRSREGIPAASRCLSSSDLEQCVLFVQFERSKLRTYLAAEQPRPLLLAEGALRTTGLAGPPAETDHDQNLRIRDRHLRRRHRGPRRKAAARGAGYSQRA